MEWIQQRRLPWRQISTVVAVLALVLVYGGVRVRQWDQTAQQAEKLTVGLVQTNRGAADLHMDQLSILREHQEMSRELAASKSPDLIVWPEGVCSLGLSSKENLLKGTLPVNPGTPMLLGTCLLQQSEGQALRASNTALLTDASGRILGSYDKTVLVPFGEYIPLGDMFPILYSWSPYSSRFLPGTSTDPLPLGKHLLSVSICYEDIFPSHIRKLMRGGRAGRIPDAMFNLTNDSWYGKSTEPMEHLALASFRSIEHRRSLVRVTNTGVSAFVDPVGRIVSRTGIWTKEVLVDKIPLLKADTVYAILGDWIGWLCAAITLAGFGLAYRTGRHGKDTTRA